jgi:DNA repair protein RadC
MTKEIPDLILVKETTDRLYQAGDVGNLSFNELLYLLIGKGTKTSSLQEIVNQILEIKHEYGLKNLPVERLMSIKGLTKSKCQSIIAALELGRRVYNENSQQRYTIRSPEDAAKYLDELKHCQQEHFVVLFLNTKNEVIGKKTVFIGSLNASIVHPREVFKEALLRSAASIVVGHNHPSGNPEPSREDIEVTKRLIEVGKMVGIELLDHVIIGFQRYISLKEKGYI